MSKNSMKGYDKKWRYAGTCGAGVIEVSIPQKKKSPNPRLAKALEWCRARRKFNITEGRMYQSVVEVLDEYLRKYESRKGRRAK